MSKLSTILNLAVDQPLRMTFLINEPEEAVAYTANRELVLVVFNNELWQRKAALHGDTILQLERMVCLD